MRNKGLLDWKALRVFWSKGHGIVLLSCKEHRKLLPKKISTANDFKALTLLSICSRQMLLHASSKECCILYKYRWLRTTVVFWVIFGKWVTGSQQSLKSLTWGTVSLMQGLKSQAENWFISSDSAYVINRELSDFRMFRANQSLQMRKPLIVMKFEEEVWQAGRF